MMLFKCMVPLALPFASAALLSACASYEQGPPFRLEAQKEDHQTSDFVDGRETIYSKRGPTEASLSIEKPIYHTGDELWLNVGFLNTTSPPQPCDLAPNGLLLRYTVGGEDQTRRAYTSDEYAALERQNKYDPEMYAVLGLADGFSQFGGAPPSLTASDLATHDDAIENRVASNSAGYLRRTTVYPGEQHVGRVHMGTVPWPDDGKIVFIIACIIEENPKTFRGFDHTFTYLIRKMES